MAPAPHGAWWLPGEGVGVPGVLGRGGELRASIAPGGGGDGRAEPPGEVSSRAGSISPQRRDAAAGPGAARLLPTAKMEGRARVAGLCPHGWIPQHQTSLGPPFPICGSPPPEDPATAPGPAATAASPLGSGIRRAKGSAKGRIRDPRPSGATTAALGGSLTPMAASCTPSSLPALFPK